MSNIKNAYIKRAEIIIEDHGLLTAFLDLNYGGMGQGFGGRCLFNEKFKDQDCCGNFIWGCLKICGVDSWGRVAGSHVRVISDSDKVHRIGHIIEDIWFDGNEIIKNLER